MTTIRIHPKQVRKAGVAGVACGDDLRDAITLLQSIPVPVMPAAMAARHRDALARVQSRLGALAAAYASHGEELQVRAAAAEAADAPGAKSSAHAGRQLERAVTATATIVGPGGRTSTVRLRSTGARVVATTSTGLRLTIPDALEGGGKASTARSSRMARDPHESAHKRSAASREVTAHHEIGGAPAAAMLLAVAAAVPKRSGSAAGRRGLGGAADPSVLSPGRHRAEERDDRGPLERVETPGPATSDRQQWACWMASAAAAGGMPPELPVMLALAQSGMRNVPGGGNEVGLFGLDPSAAYAPSGFGVGQGTRPGGDWWSEHPDAQLEHVMGRLEGFGGGIRTQALDDPDALARWASEAAPHVDAEQLADAHTAAGELVGGCRQGHAGGLGAQAGSPLKIAQSQLGTHETTPNAGPQVDRYLASASVSSGNPWCASFIAWSMHESGHDMPGTGWASVAHWVSAAEAGQHGLQFVDASDARPGDIVAYDWGGQSDFAGDGHIGFLESNVVDGHFTTVEGNSQDAVTRMQRSLDSGNVVFMRMAA